MAARRQVRNALWRLLNPAPLWGIVEVRGRRVGHPVVDLNGRSSPLPLTEMAIAAFNPAQGWIDLMAADRSCRSPLRDAGVGDLKLGAGGKNSAMTAP